MFVFRSQRKLVLHKYLYTFQCLCLLSRLGDVSEASWGRLGGMSRALEGILAPAWKVFGACWKHLESVLEASSGRLGILMNSDELFNHPQ